MNGPLTESQAEQARKIWGDSAHASSFIEELRDSWKPPENSFFSKEMIDKIINRKEGLRMYGFVMYNLSGIQKGIQMGHCALEYAEKFGQTPKYRDFIKNHKTFIVLDGGGSNCMIEREKELEALGVDFASFQEPDLNNSISAIVFLVPESVYDAQESIFAFGPHPENSKELDFKKYLRSFRLASN